MSDTVRKLNIPGIIVTRVKPKNPEFMALKGLGHTYNPNSRIATKIRKKAKEREAEQSPKTIDEELAEQMRTEHRREVIASALLRSQEEAKKRQARQESIREKIRANLANKGLYLVDGLFTNKKLSGENAA